MADEKKVREIDTAAWADKVNADARKEKFGGGSQTGDRIDLGATCVELEPQVIASTIGEARKASGLVQ